MLIFMVLALPAPLLAGILYLENTAREVPYVDNVVKDHARNCFFTPVQCMLPSDSQRDILQSLRGVYHSANVRRESLSPWSYNEQFKRSNLRSSFKWLA